MNRKILQWKSVKIMEKIYTMKKHSDKIFTQTIFGEQKDFNDNWDLKNIKGILFRSFHGIQDETGMRSG